MIKIMEKVPPDIFSFGKSPITWCCQKQETVTLSSYEVEYLAGYATSCQAVWLWDLLGEITGSQVQEVVIKIDNTSTMTLIKNPVFYGRSKHIKSRFHYIRERVEDKEITIEHVSGNEQRVDILTKVLVS